MEVENQLEIEIPEELKTFYESIGYGFLWFGLKQKKGLYRILSPEEILDLYFKQCSIEIDCIDLARIGINLAMYGVDIESKERLISEKVSRMIKTFMVTCGMYDASGEFAIRVGIPAKSGVGGGVMASVPEKMGIGVYGPALDKKGNSIAGIKVLEDLSEKLELNIF